MTALSLSLSNMSKLTIPGFCGVSRSTNAEYSKGLLDADRGVFQAFTFSPDSSAFHKFIAHFPLDALGGAKDITIIISEQFSAVKGTKASKQSDRIHLSGYYDLTNVGEENPLLVRETNAFARVVFNSESRSIQLELPDQHTSTNWTLTQ